MKSKLSKAEIRSVIQVLNDFCIRDERGEKYTLNTVPSFTSEMELHRWKMGLIGRGLDKIEQKDSLCRHRRNFM